MGLDRLLVFDIYEDTSKSTLFKKKEEQVERFHPTKNP